jgi:hypothetical protein
LGCLLAELERFSASGGVGCGSPHIDTAQIHESGGEPWAVAYRGGEALSGAVRISLLNLDNAKQILDAAIIWEPLTCIGYQHTRAIEIVRLNLLLD